MQLRQVQAHEAQGVVCDKCGVEVTQSKVRRERMGHIELASPGRHIWFFKACRSRIGNLLDITLKDLERVLYCEAYIVIDPGETPPRARSELLTEEQVPQAAPRSTASRLQGRAWAPRRSASCSSSVDVRRARPASCASRCDDARAQPEAQEDRQAPQGRGGVPRSGNKPEWMILDGRAGDPARPAPAGAARRRPLRHLATSTTSTAASSTATTASSGCSSCSAPEIIIRNEKRMLQEAVDALFDNGRRGRAITGPEQAPAQVAVRHAQGQAGPVPPEPARQARRLLGPLGHRRRPGAQAAPVRPAQEDGARAVQAVHHTTSSRSKGYVTTIKSAKKMVEKERARGLGHPRGGHHASTRCCSTARPTLHRLGIQAFEPVLIEGKAIQLHPLVCAAFNADFDGDQMAVHVPLSHRGADRGARADDVHQQHPVAGQRQARSSCPTQDIVLGLYYMTRERESTRAAEDDRELRGLATTRSCRPTHRRTCSPASRCAARAPASR